MRIKTLIVILTTLVCSIQAYGQTLHLTSQNSTSQDNTSPDITEDLRFHADRIAELEEQVTEWDLNRYDGASVPREALLALGESLTALNQLDTAEDYLFLLLMTDKMANGLLHRQNLATVGLLLDIEIKRGNINAARDYHDYMARHLQGLETMDQDWLEFAVRSVELKRIRLQAKDYDSDTIWRYQFRAAQTLHAQVQRYLALQAPVKPALATKAEQNANQLERLQPQYLAAVENYRKERRRMQEQWRTQRSIRISDPYRDDYSLSDYDRP